MILPTTLGLRWVCSRSASVLPDEVVLVRRLAADPPPLSPASDRLLVEPGFELVLSCRTMLDL